jgi:hypothetical protein
MTVSTLVLAVRVVLIVIYCQRSDVRWMLMDLGKELPSVRLRIGFGIGPEGIEKRVEHESIRQAPDYYPRIQ